MYDFSNVKYYTWKNIHEIDNSSRELYDVFLHFDSDGVLFKFYKDLEALHNDGIFLDVTDTKQAFFLEPKYYYLVKEFPEMQEVTKKLNDVLFMEVAPGVICRVHFDVLSCYPLDSQTALSDKHMALNDKYPFIRSRIFVPYDENRSGENKLQAVGLPTPLERFYPEISEDLADYRLNTLHILFDDYTNNLFDWEAHGGIGVKVKNDINCQKGRWKGPSVDIFSPTLFQDILSVSAKSIYNELTNRFGWYFKKMHEIENDNDIKYYFYQLKPDSKYLYQDLDEKINNKPSIRETLRIGDYDLVYEGPFKCILKILMK